MFFYFCAVINSKYMLIKFSVKNFRGFSKEISWDLSKPSNYEFNTNSIKDGVVKNGIIYGPNGSGKTSFGLAIFDIVNHLSQKWKKPDYYNNFVYAGNPQSPVDFEYVFKFGTKIVDYSYSKNANGELLRESLIVNNEEVLKRDGTNIEIKTFPSIEENAIRNLNVHANNFSFVNQLLISIPLPEDHYLLQLQKFANSMLWFRCLDMKEFIGLDYNTSNIDEYIIRNNLTKDFETFLQETSEQMFLFDKSDPNDKLLYCIIEGNKVSFHDIASTGTNSLTLLYFWIKKMEQTQFVFIDEFDAFYHFKLSFEVCRRLFKFDGQVFLSSHNTSLMTNDLLRPDCNFLLNNNKIKPFCDCTDKELRWGHSIEKLYRGGTFKI